MFQSKFQKMGSIYKKNIHLVYYENIEDATKARREKANELFGEYLNSCEK